MAGGLVFEAPRSAVAALGKTPDRQSALAIARLLTDPAGRTSAADLLKVMKLRDREVEAEVRKALGSDDPATRETACRVLEVLGTATSVPALKRAAADPQRNVAAAASKALGAITTPAKSRTPADRFKGRMRKAR